MQLIPAIDLKDGQCVRLFKGRFDEVTHYDVNPVRLAQRYAEAGAQWLHVVDLDGARDGEPVNTAAIRAIVQATGLNVQVGGGLRTLEAVERLLDVGTSRVVIGSLAVREPERVAEWLATLGPARVVLALDIRFIDEQPILMTHGWTRASSMSLWQALDHYLAHGLLHLLCTDVERDGAMQGPNFALYRECCQRYPSVAVQASGGVRHAQDLDALAAGGVSGAISGRALLDGALQLHTVAAYLPGHRAELSRPAKNGGTGPF